MKKMPIFLQFGAKQIITLSDSNPQGKMKPHSKVMGALGKAWILLLTCSCMDPLANLLGLLYSYSHFTDGEREGSNEDSASQWWEQQ